MTSEQPPLPGFEGAQRRPSLDELLRAVAALPEPPTERGRLVHVTRRHAPGVHESLASVTLSREEGVPGDSWNRRLPPNPDAQVSVVRADVAELIASGLPLSTSGDNLAVDLDISAANLPCGTRLRVGDAVVVVTPKPHVGCAKFAARFGADALAFVKSDAGRRLNLRGIYWRVVEPGLASVGSPVEVLARA